MGNQSENKIIANPKQKNAAFNGNCHKHYFEKNGIANSDVNNGVIDNDTDDGGVNETGKVDNHIMLKWQSFYKEMVAFREANGNFDVSRDLPLG